MKIDYSKEYLLQLLDRQLSMFMVTPFELESIKKNLDAVLNRIDYSFKFNANKYYSKDGETYFNPFHSGQWTIFLYYLGNTIFKNNSDDRVICDKIYYLNKMLNGCDIFYEINLPDIYMSDHPVGTVMGRATYANYFSFCQGCTVGNNKGVFPVFGEYVTMLSDSKVIGNCNIGNNVIIGANAYIKDQDIPSNTIVFGISPNLVIKPNMVGKLNFK